jgi:DNA-binding beta-propeller fold protein YncE
MAVGSVTNRISAANVGNRGGSVIHGATNAVAAKIPLVEDGWPRVVAVNPTTSRIYVPKHLDETVPVIEDPPQYPNLIETAIASPPRS